MTYLRPTEKFVAENAVIWPERLEEHLAWLEATNGVPYQWLVTATFRKPVDDIVHVERAFANFKKRVTDDIFGRQTPTTKFWGVIEDSEFRQGREVHLHWHCLITETSQYYRSGLRRKLRWKHPPCGFGYHLRRVALVTSYNGVEQRNRISNIDIQPITDRQGAIDYLLKGIKTKRLIVLTDSDLEF